MMVIMLAGQARVGKTTLANWLAEYLYHKGYYPVMLPFAGMLKDEVKAMGYTKESHPKEYRELCQKIGAGKRAEDPDYWVKKFKEKALQIKDEDVERLEANPKGWTEKVLLVDDCRYMNEVALGRELGALQIFISRGKRELEDQHGEWRKHESEDMANAIEAGDKNYEDVFHYRVVNEGSLSDYKKKVTDLFDEWLIAAGESDPLCTCEVCKSHRMDKDIDIEKVIDDLIHMIEEEMDKEDDTHK